jgi:hypothetical protein
MGAMIIVTHLTAILTPRIAAADKDSGGLLFATDRDEFGISVD